MPLHCAVNSGSLQVKYSFTYIVNIILVCTCMYTIRLKFSNFFIHHYFQNQMFEKFAYAFNMSNDAQIHVSRRVCVLFSRARVATLR